MLPKNKKEVKVRNIFSVIVPVYNAEKYLEKCLDSISKQTVTDFECIIIDDGTTDNSNIIIDKYVNNDQRFNVIHQKNLGVSAARNAGLDIAKGDYITFVDSDDYVSSDFLEKFVSKITNSNADIVICGLNEVYKDFIKEKVFESENTEEIKTKILADLWPSYPCNKCFEKKLFVNIRFPVGKVFEDLLTIPEVCLYAQKIVCVSDKLYYYNCQNTSSITARLTSEKMYNAFEGHLKNRQLAVVNKISCIKELDKQIIDDARHSLIKNYNDNKLSDSQEQELCKYLKERLDKSEIIGLRNKFWVRMLLAKRKTLCTWYARFRNK